MADTETLDPPATEEPPTPTQKSEDENQDRNNPKSNPSRNSRGGSSKSGRRGLRGAGQNAAKKLNGLTDKGMEKASKALTPLVQAGVKLGSKLEKKFIPNEEARLAFRVVRFLGPAAPYVIAGIVILVLIIAVLNGSSGAGPNDPNNPNTPKLTISKTGPTEVNIDVNPILDYQITVSYPGTAQDIVITDNIPAGTEFDPALNPPPAKFDPATRTITWNLKDTLIPPATVLSAVNTTLSLKLKATVNNSFLVNQASGTVIGAGAPPPTTDGYIPPNDNDCGKYSSIISKNRFLSKNYGDPECNFDKAEVDRLLREKDGANADWWFLVIQCESGYNPNNWLDPDTIVGGYRSPDAGGAWGLFQNGSSAVFPDRLYGSARQESVRLEEAIELPGRPPPAVGRSQDPNDRGDLSWPLQIENAIKLLPERGKGYWACA